MAINTRFRETVEMIVGFWETEFERKHRIFSFQNE